MEDKRGTAFAEENAAEETAHDETAAAEEAPDIEMTENPDAESDEEEDAAASEYNDTASQYSDLEDALSERNMSDFSRSTITTASVHQRKK